MQRRLGLRRKMMIMRKENRGDRDLRIFFYLLLSHLPPHMTGLAEEATVPKLAFANLVLRKYGVRSMLSQNRNNYAG